MYHIDLAALEYWLVVQLHHPIFVLVLIRIEADWIVIVEIWIADLNKSSDEQGGRHVRIGEEPLAEFLKSVLARIGK